MNAALIFLTLTPFFELEEAEFGAGDSRGATDLRTGVTLTRAGEARDNLRAQNLVGTQIRLPSENSRPSLGQRLRNTIRRTLGR